MSDPCLTRPSHIAATEHKRIRFYQAGIRRLPFKNRAALALGLLLGRRIKAVVNQATVRLDLREAIQRQMFLGTYEPTQTEWFKRCLGPGDTIVDVGASFGYYTTLGASLVGPAGKVFAFEPSPIASATIEDTIKDSMMRNAVLTRAAVGKENGNASLFLPTGRKLHSPSILQGGPGFVPIQVPVVALDHFEPLQNVPQVQLVKIDVEGYEPDVLHGMENLIKARRIKNIICEFNSGWLRRNSIAPKELLERFLDLGCRIRMQTELKENLPEPGGEVFDLQDIWFSVS